MLVFRIMHFFQRGLPVVITVPFGVVLAIVEGLILVSVNGLSVAEDVLGVVSVSFGRQYSGSA